MGDSKSACLSGRRFRTRDTPGSPIVPQRTHKIGLLARKVHHARKPLCRGGRIPAHASESIRRHTQDLSVQPASLTGAVAGNCNCKNRKIGAKYSHPQEPWLRGGANVVSRRRCDQVRYWQEAEYPPSSDRPLRSAVQHGGCSSDSIQAPGSSCALERSERFGPESALATRLPQPRANPNRVLTTLRYANKDVGHVFPWRESWSRCR